jgi:hypothetical protein
VSRKLFRFSGLRFIYQKIIAPLWEKFVIWRYKKAGLKYGESCSYIVHFGLSLDFTRREWKYYKWKDLYQSLGYEPVPDEVFELVGGGWRRLDELDKFLYIPEVSN